MLARVQTALYRGDAEAAWRLLEEHESNLRRSLLTLLQVFRVELHYMRARTALAMAAGHRAPRRFLAIARSRARRIARDRKAWSDPIALLLQAAIANVEGNTQMAAKHLRDAIDRFERADMNLYVAVARCRLGALQGGEAGRTLQRDGEEWMAAQSIKRPDFFTRMLAPGFDDRVNSQGPTPNSQ
jgi:hypothetical protein